MRKRVLIVDDQFELRKLVRMTLEGDDYELFEAVSGPHALEMAEIVLPNLVILDVMMPGGLDGYAVCERLKSSTQLGSINVLMLTAKGQLADLAEGQRVRADAYLSKPFSPLNLIDVVGRALQ
jgi:CheY-like chemotaxis protein